VKGQFVLLIHSLWPRVWAIQPKLPRPGYPEPRTHA